MARCRAPIGRARLVLLAAFVLASVATACGGGVSVADAWVRAAADGAESTAGYLTITNGGGASDALVSVSSPSAGAVMIHETKTDASGMVGMSPIERLDVPAGATVKLEPKALHLMLMEPQPGLVAGSTVELDLVFEHAGKVVVRAAVR